MSGERTVEPRLGEVVSDIEIPLENLVYTIEAYLMANGTWLDTETRFLLAGVRDCADRLAGSVRRVARQGGPAQAPRPPDVRDSVASQACSSRSSSSRARV